MALIYFFNTFIMDFKKFILVVGAIVVLSACDEAVNDKNDVELTGEELTELEEQVSELEQEIENHVSEEGESPNIEIISLAQTHEKLGELEKAVQVYEEAIANDQGTRAIYNNLGNLYEDLEQYEKAVEAYQVMVDKYVEKSYLKEIAWVYIRSENLEKAKEYYDQWKEASGETDGSVEQRIEILSEKLQ